MRISVVIGIFVVAGLGIAVLFAALGSGSSEEEIYFEDTVNEGEIYIADEDFYEDDTVTESDEFTQGNAINDRRAEQLGETRRTTRVILDAVNNN
jgi:hypothetical protein